MSNQDQEAAVFLLRNGYIQHELQFHETDEDVTTVDNTWRYKHSSNAIPNKDAVAILEIMAQKNRLVGVAISMGRAYWVADRAHESPSALQALAKHYGWKPSTT